MEKLHALLGDTVKVEMKVISKRMVVIDYHFEGILRFIYRGLYCVEEKEDKRGIGIVYFDLLDENVSIVVRPKVIYLTIKY